jgi:hypothetical protein
MPPLEPARANPHCPKAGKKRRGRQSYYTQNCAAAASRRSGAWLEEEKRRERHKVGRRGGPTGVRALPPPGLASLRRER